MKKTVPNYLEVFEGRLKELIKKIKREYEKSKKDRSTHNLKAYIKEAKKLKSMLKEAREDHSVKCPHCGKKLQETR